MLQIVELLKQFIVQLCNAPQFEMALAVNGGGKGEGVKEKVLCLCHKVTVKHWLQ